MLLNAKNTVSLSGQLRIEDLLGYDPALVPDISLKADLDKIGFFG